VWLAFGAIAIDRLNWTLVVYAVLSLTVVRMVPVAMSLIGSGMDRDTVLFIGWFGPRGWRHSSSRCSRSKRSDRQRTMRWRSSR
jgi:hypothetical protein